MSTDFTTLVDLLRWRAFQQSDQVGFTFLEKGKTDLVLTYAELDRQARRIAVVLQDWKIEGERALLLFPPSLQYIAAFFGCLYARVIPVPVYPPRPNKPMPRLEAIVSDAKPRLALTTTQVLAHLKNNLDPATPPGALRWLNTDTLTAEIEDQWHQPQITCDSLAFLQYTSGSTTAPKGVMLSHENLLYNLSQIQHCCEYTSRSCAVSWLPPYHDLGLIGGILQPLYGNFPVTFLSPVSFLQNPIKWLQVISTTHATTSGGPNFAYDLCVSKSTPAQRADLDLSHWEVAFTGAEPIRPGTLARFAEAFAPYGFRQEAFYPCYGLAESTLVVSGGARVAPPIIRRFDSQALQQDRVVCVAQDAENASALVSNGRCLPSEQIVIAHPHTMQECSPDEIGEIWLSSQSVTKGYWNKPAQTEYTFHAFLANTGKGPFLRTGDLGFLHHEELFVTGRLKDLIIIRGQNHYPQDIEQTIERSHPLLRPGGGAAFSLPVDGEERLVIIHELEARYQHADHEEVIGAIQQAIAENHELQAYGIVLIRPGHLPKTSSGKVQRYRCRELFQNDGLSVIKRWVQDEVAEHLSIEAVERPGPFKGETDLEHWLITQLATHLRISPAAIDTRQAITRYGVDSLVAIELLHAIETECGVQVPLGLLLQGIGIANLAEEIEVLMRDPKTTQSSTLAQELPAVFPLSPGQEALWLLHQLVLDSSPSNIPIAVRVRTPLHISEFSRAIEALIERHSQLRTTFYTEDGQPKQRVHKKSENGFEIDEKLACDETYLRRRLQIIANQPFDLEHGPLFRIRLFQCSASESVLLLVFHHIIIDLWSFEILFRELNILYSALIAGEGYPQLPIIPEYQEHVAKQLSMLNGSEGETQWSYWQNQLAGELPVLNLPTDYPRPPIQTYRGATHNFAIEEGLARQLRVLSEGYGVTLYTTLLSSFQALLHHYTAQDDILIGSPVAGRRQAADADVIGYFVNILVLRSQFSRALRFDELLSQTQRCVLQALDHQDFPFELLAQRLHQKRDLSRSPIFQVMFALQSTHTPGIAAYALGEVCTPLVLGNAALEPVKIEQQTAQYDLKLVIVEGRNKLAASLEYNTDLFDRATIERLGTHFVSTLNSIVTNPCRLVERLPLLTPSEQRTILDDWNPGFANQAPDVCLHELIERQVERTPHAVAVTFEDHQLSYEQLNSRANQLAHYLQSLGMGPEKLVGIFMERSIELIVGLLGSLKTGGAYVPLDPSYPQDYLAFNIDDAQVPVLLTTSHLIDKLPTTQAKIICLDADWKQVATQSQLNPHSKVSPANIAYAIYTSGSTGKPKGTMNIHSAVCNYLLWIQSLCCLTADDRVLQKTPINFDVSVSECFWPLLCGARLVMAQPGGHQDVEYLVTVIPEHQITTIRFVPSMLQMFLSHESIEHCSMLKQVICSGEALPLTLQQEFCAKLDVNLYNLYGPTEAAIDVTFWPCVQTELRTVPIGRPITNNTIYLLNNQLQPVPVGVAGELYIGGAGPGRGYYRRPDLTADRFIPNPFSKTSGERLYKTGDVARYLPDGVIEYLGRLDHQVKVRGFRIELNEIETVLRDHPGVREAVVVAKGEPGAEKRLIGYLVPASKQGVLIRDVRAFLQARIPNYMVPAFFVLCESFPLTPSGKVDHKALPAIDGQRPDLDMPIVQPRTPVENTLAEIWCAVLGIEQIGIHDNFFELGGDSIRGIQVVAKAAQAGLYLTVRQILEHQTIARLAEVATYKQHIKAEQELITGVVPLTPIQHWFFEQDLPELHHWNQAMVFETVRALSLPLLTQALKALTLHHDALRMRFTKTREGWTQTIAGPEVVISASMVDLTYLSAMEQAIALKDASSKIQGDLNLTSGPLMQATIFDLGQGRRGRLLLAIHHLIIDGLSWTTLIEDLQTIYEQLSRNEAVSLPPKTTSFKQWARQLQEYAQSKIVEQEQAFWLANFATTRLPRDMSLESSENTERFVELVSVELSLAETEALLSSSLKAYNLQSSDLLLAALADTIASWAGRESIMIDLEGHGRETLFEDADISRTIGWFTSIFPVRLHVASEMGLEDLLITTKEQLRRIPCRGIGYGLLRYLHADEAIAAELRDIPQAEILFNYLGRLDQAEAHWPLLRLAHEHCGTLRGASNTRRYILELNSLVQGGRLFITWHFNNRLHRRHTIEALAQRFLAKLQALIAHCLTSGNGRYTPADFPLVRIDQATLDQVLGSRKRSEVEDLFPLSALQQGMLFHSLLHPDLRLYFGQLTLTLQGKLDSSAFQAAWQQVLNRHQMLRAACLWQNVEQPLQVIYRQVALPFEQFDWRSMPPEEQAQELEKLLKTDRFSGFHLSKAPLIRIALIQIAEAAHYFVWTYHHMALDGWSLSLLLKEAWEIYHATCEARLPQLAEPSQYRDYIAWLQRQDFSEAEQFWRKRLNGFTASTPPGIEPAPEGSIDKQAYGEQHVTFSVTETDTLQTFVRRHHLTLNALIQGVWALLLSRYAGLQDVVFGVTTSGRAVPVAKIETIAGLFINTLPLRVTVQPDNSFLTMLKEIHVQLFELIQFEYTPLRQILRWSELPGGAQLFESIVVFENYPIDVSLQSRGDLLVNKNIRSMVKTNYPLAILVFQQDELSIHIKYDNHIFHTAAIAQVLQQFQIVLEQIIATPAMPIKDISLLPAGVRQVRTDSPALLDPYRSDGSLVLQRHVQVSSTARKQPTTAQPSSAGIAGNGAQRSSIEQLLSELWQQVLEVEEVGLHDNFFDLGGHSVLMIRMQSKLEEVLGYPVAIVDLFDSPTISSLATCLAEKYAANMQQEDDVSMRGSLDRAELRTNLMMHRRKRRTGSSTRE